MELSTVFAARLKAARKEHGYTQKELARRICYSEKAVSKWEQGGGIPPVEVLMLLAEQLHTTIGALLSPPGQADYFLGIDGGGTKTAFLLENEEGGTVAELVLGPSNPNDISMEGCLSVLREGITTVCVDIPLSRVAVFAGLAGGSSGNNGTFIKKALDGYGFAAAFVGSDAQNAMEISLADGDGVALIAGTGTIAFARNGKEIRRVAGWGYLFDKGGSGYDVARDGIQAVLAHVDGRSGETVMSDLFRQRLGKTVSDAIPDLYRGGKQFIASLAPAVFEAADKGDGMALAILDRNAAAMAETILAARRHVANAAAPAVICGGLARRQDLLEPLVKKYLPPELPLVFTTREMVRGAVMIARRYYHEQH